MHNAPARLRPLLVVAAFIAAGVCLAGPETPYTPARDDIVLQTLPSTADPRVRAFDALRADLQRHPDAITPAVALSRAYLDYGRGTGDARYLGRAAAVIAPWMAREPVPLPVLLVHATILQSKHYFAEARALLQEILRRDGDNAQAWLTLATVAQVQGDMFSARRACSHLLGSSDALIPGGCLASLSTVDGHAESAYRTLKLLLPQVHAAEMTEQIWIQGLMADTAIVLGDAAAADSHYRAALQLAPGDNFLLADYADFLLDQKRPADALNLVKDYATSDTSFLRQVLAEIALDLPRAGADTEQMARRWAAIDLRGSRTYGREEAMFALHAEHDAARALTLAQENWSVQRAPRDARIFLEAALAAGQPRAAQPVLQHLTDTHLEDPLVTALAAQVNAALAASPPTTNAYPAIVPGAPTVPNATPTATIPGQHP